MTKLRDEILGLIAKVDESDRKAIFQEIRKQISLHPLEQEWGVPAEAILSAIGRATDLTKRGIRGILAESIFEQVVIPILINDGWKQLEITGDKPYDFYIAQGKTKLGIQVKLQRKQRGVPMEYPTIRRTALVSAPARLVCVEVQKTRSGQSGGEATRPYRFGDFDILAVNLQPSTGDWNRFMFTPASWLLQRKADPDLIEIFQPVSLTPDSYWTDDLNTCIEWNRKKEPRKLYEK
ncbi:MAG: hypothetical protein ACHQT6_09410 [Candidatus Acidiferrales bacterium]